MLEIIKEISDLLAVVIPLLISLFILIAKLTKNTKLRILSENFIQVEKVIKKYMENAESFINYSGADKKEWVKTKVNQFCIENDMPYNESVVDSTIERFIDLTKTVNKREKDMVKL